jgi:hypothetical protein
MTAHYITTQARNAARERKPTFQPRKTLPVDFSLPILPAM